MDWNTIAKEIKYSFSRPTATGDQHIYKMETRVKLQFNVPSSKGLTPEEKTIIIEKFDHIVSKKGILALNASRDRSQSANKKYVTERFQDMLTELFKQVPKRVPTKRPAGGNESRLKVKHENAARKVSRRKPEL
jgi:ribosome-associated protein